MTETKEIDGKKCSYNPSNKRWMASLGYKKGFEVCKTESKPTMEEEEDEELEDIIQELHAKTKAELKEIAKDYYGMAKISGLNKEELIEEILEAEEIEDEEDELE